MAHTAASNTPDNALDQLVSTLLTPHDHTTTSALVLLAGGGSGLPRALVEGYAVPDLTAPTSPAPDVPSCARPAGAAATAGQPAVGVLR